MTSNPTTSRTSLQADTTTLQTTEVSETTNEVPASILVSAMTLGLTEIPNNTTKADVMTTSINSNITIKSDSTTTLMTTAATLITTDKTGTPLTTTDSVG